jgi:hypothetical protein
MTWRCTINDPARAAKAMEVYGEPSVPITSCCYFPWPMALLIGIHLAYLTDLDALTADQLERLIARSLRTSTFHEPAPHSQRRSTQPPP